MKYERTITVAASPERIWEAVSSLANWPEWTASMETLEVLDKPLGNGARVRVRQPGLRPAVFTVDDWQPGVGFHYTASSTGVRIEAGHWIDTTTAGEPRLRLTLRLTGALATLLAPLIGARIRRYVDMETDGLRRYAEHLQPHSDAA